MSEIMDENHLESDNNCNIFKYTVHLFYYKELTNNLRFTFSVGDITWAIYNH